MKSNNTSDDKNLEMKYVMVIETSDYLNRLEAHQFNLFTQKLHNSVSKTLQKFKGKIISYNDNTYLVSFKSVTNAVLCALKIQSNFKYITPKFDSSIRKLKIAIAHLNVNKDALILATRMCEVVKNEIVISSEVKTHYESENRNFFINKEHIRTLNFSEEQFLINLMNYIETIWNDSSFSTSKLSKPLKYSTSQVYRKITSLTGKSPSAFIKNFRLNRALSLIHKRKGNITEIAQQTGFKSATYFSKCFKDKFEVTPITYSKQHA
ncbi:MAG: AraC family transcriptional regulator [Flavobacteriaceae bacterium]|nr:AraC family transcriptional regulator [Flavobacteriaceae bacterium]